MFCSLLKAEGKLILGEDKKEIIGGTPEMLVTGLIRMKSLGTLCSNC